MAQRKRYVSRRFVEKSQRAVVYVILTVVSLIWVFPFFYLVFQSLGKNATGSIFPAEGQWTFDNYINVIAYMLNFYCFCFSAFFVNTYDITFF